MKILAQFGDTTYVIICIYSISTGAEMPKVAYRPSLYPKGGQSLGVCAKDQVSTLFASCQPWRCEPTHVNFQSPHSNSNDTSFFQETPQSDSKKHHNLKQEIANNMDGVITKIASEQCQGKYHTYNLHISKHAMQ